jgi:proteasome accessory factor B
MIATTLKKTDTRPGRSTIHADPKIRLLRLWGLLSNGEAKTPSALAKIFGVNTRTIHRDLRILNKAGCRLCFNRKTKGYCCDNTGFLPPMDFLPDEALAMMLLARHIPDDPVLENAAQRAMHKIRSHLPPKLQEQLTPLEHHVTVRPVGIDNAQSAKDVYNCLQQAIREQREVLCQYDAARSSENDGLEKLFIFRPYHLLFSNRAWYVIGYRVDRRAQRSLKLIRFTQINLTDKHFAFPPGFTVADYLGQCWRMIPATRRYHIRLKIDADFATGTAETQWHSTQEVEMQADGSVIMSFDIDGLDEIVWWILGLGPHCRVLEPGELIASVHELALKTAQLYTT